MRLFLLQGANMEWLGKRDPAHYGTITARELDALVKKRAKELQVKLDILYTNVEGEAVKAIYKAVRSGVDGILFNPAGFLHEGAALRDCLAQIEVPAIEIHMSNIEKRGRRSITVGAALGMIAGFREHSYLLALDAMVARIRLGLHRDSIILKSPPRLAAREQQRMRALLKKAGQELPVGRSYGKAIEKIEKLERGLKNQLVVCTSNKGYETSLQRKKTYATIVDRAVEKRGLLRVIDESGDDYLYDKALFRMMRRSRAS
jgi:3-dehydroquinate dehydratase-2